MCGIADAIVEAAEPAPAKRGPYKKPVTGMTRRKPQRRPKGARLDHNLDQLFESHRTGMYRGERISRNAKDGNDAIRLAGRPFTPGQREATATSPRWPGLAAGETTFIFTCVNCVTRKARPQVS